jgi:hypothetical protein
MTDNFATFIRRLSRGVLGGSISLCRYHFTEHTLRQGKRIYLFMTLNASKNNFTEKHSAVILPV